MLSEVMVNVLRSMNVGVVDNTENRIKLSLIHKYGCSVDEVIKIVRKYYELCKIKISNCEIENRDLLFWIFSYIVFDLESSEKPMQHPEVLSESHD